ncbi:uncharacterized protein [Triticum aestivum]|uniref:uncharacterized protein isoform X2 n=1 Tax=Triticum aestivum TaxID=4565 RepID=UPI001D02A296|nr:uncharacterized protein LOC123135230 isoform X2 [Triticum aestivum]
MDVVSSIISSLLGKLVEIIKHGSSDEHASRQESMGLKPELLEISGSTWFREDWKISGPRKYVLLLATLVITVTYQAGLNSPGGYWPDTESEHSRCQGSNKLKYVLFLCTNATPNITRIISRESVSSSTETPNTRRQGSNKLKDVPWKGSRTLFSCTAVVAFWYTWQNLLEAQVGNRTIITVTVIICLVCTIVIMFKAQADRNLASASRDSELLSVASYKETIEPENTSCSDSMAAFIAVAKIPATWLVGSASTHHATGNRALLSGFKSVDGHNIHTGDGVRMPVCGRGCVITDAVVLPDVLFVPGLKKNIVSVSQLTQLGCSIVFKRDACYISGATDGTTIGKALVGENGMFKLEFLKVPLVN